MYSKLYGADLEQTLCPPGTGKAGIVDVYLQGGR